MISDSPFSYDLLNTCRRNPAKAAKVQAALLRVDTVNQDIARGKASRDDLVRAQADLMTASDFNFGLLIPMYFPRYPLDSPLSLLARPFMFAMTCMAPDSVVTLKAGRQVGKCVDGDTEVVTDALGAMRIEDLFEMGHPMIFR